MTTSPYTPKGEYQRLCHILDNWLHNIQPSEFRVGDSGAEHICDVMLSEARDDPEWCQHIVLAHEGGNVEGAGLNIEDMLGFALMLVHKLEQQ